MQQMEAVMQRFILARTHRAFRLRTSGQDMQQARVPFPGLTLPVSEQIRAASSGLSPMNKAALSAVLLCFSASTCLAATQCPSSLQGHPLKKVDGGSVFYKNPADNMLQAPSESHTESNGWWTNTWRFLPGSASTMTVVCQYDGQQQSISFRLPTSTRICRQDVTSFVCD